MRHRIRLRFCDFWKTFDPANNAILNMLRSRFDVELSERPDFVIYSCFGDEHYRHDCVRIQFIGENVRPNWSEADYAFTFDHTANPRHYRWPLYGLYGDPQGLIKRPMDAADVLRRKTKFCNFIFSNPRCAMRNRFFDLLSKYKRVDAGGKVRNNLGHRVGNKLEFIRDYKFTIAFENTSHPGYTTEKIAEPMWVHSLPIYWGNPLVHLDFNPRSFVNYHDFGSLEALVQRVIEIDQNDELYLEHVRQPWFLGNQVPAYLLADNVLDRFEHIFTTPITPIAIASPLSLYGQARRTWRAARRWVQARWQPPAKVA